MVGRADERLDQTSQGMIVARGERSGEVAGVAVVEWWAMLAGWMVLTGTSGVAVGAGGVDLSTAPPRRYLAFMAPLSIPAIRGVRRAMGVVGRHGCCG
jgi:hypothetical protein